MGGEIPEQILTYAYPKDFRRLDPGVAFSAENDILNQIYETLTDYDVASGEVKPMLATSWEHNATGTEWTFHLRDGVTFQDGSPFTADAVKFSVERTKKGGKGPAYLYDPVTAIDVVDPHTVKFSLSSPQPLDLIFSGPWGAFIQNPATDDQPEEWFDQGNGVGTGPYRWVSYSKSQSAVLERYPGYWKGWTPGQVTKVVYNLTPDSTTRKQQVLSGEAQLTFNLPVRDLPALSQDQRVTVVPLQVLQQQYWLFNTIKAPTDSAKVRQAFAYAYPADTVISTVYGGTEYVGKNTNSFVPHSLWGSADIPGLDYDLDKAKEKLVEAGHPGGNISAELAVDQAFPDTLTEAELWRAALGQVGVTLNVRPVTVSEYGDLQRNDPENRPILGSSWIPTYATPQDYLFSKFATGGLNESSYKNADFDALVQQGLEESAVDREKAGKTFVKAQELLFRDMPGMPTISTFETFVAPKNVSGIRETHLTVSLFDLRIAQP